MLPAPLKGTVPPTETLRRWTHEEYDRLVELGAFQSGERLELLVAPATTIGVADLFP